MHSRLMSWVWVKRPGMADLHRQLQALQTWSWFGGHMQGLAVDLCLCSLSDDPYLISIVYIHPLAR